MRWTIPFACLVAISVATIALGGVSAAGGSEGSHPPPVKAASGHAVALCPNPRGLDAFTAAASRLARREAAEYGRHTLAVDLRNADRAWWPQVHELWKTRTRPPSSRLFVLGTEPAPRSGFAVFLRPACGGATLARTLMVTLGPSQSGSGPHCDACNAHLFYVNRSGQPRLWYVY